MESFKRCPECQSELAKYRIGALVTCFEVSQALIKKGVDVALPVLTKLRGALVPSKSTLQEAPRPSSSVAQVQKGEAQAPAEEGVI